ncbi:Bacterioferritin [compost metagenome]
MENVSHDVHHPTGYASPLPYPEIQVTEKNRYYAELLMEDYAGVFSEFTAVSQYIYHDFVIKNKQREIAEMLKHIAVVEMKHMDKLAQAIILLGGNPIYRGCCINKKKCNFWNETFVYYGNNIYDQLKADLNSEYKAIESYRNHIEMIKDPYITALLERIILDEEVHIELFKGAI